MSEERDVELDAVAAVARITALEMLVRQTMIVQLRILDKMGEIKLDPYYIKGMARAYAEKVDESPVIESGWPDVNTSSRSMCCTIWSGFSMSLRRISGRIRKGLRARLWLV